jgi:hypothetical protein
LLAESELNRAQLVQDLQTMADETRSLVHQAQTISRLASFAATLVVGLMSCRRKASPPAAAKPSWMSTIVKVAGLFSTFWSEFRGRH